MSKWLDQWYHLQNLDFFFSGFPHLSVSFLRLLKPTSVFPFLLPPFLYFKAFYWLRYYNFPNFSFLSFIWPASPTLVDFPPPLFRSMGCTYKLFEFSVSYTILNLSISILCLPIMLLITCTFPPHSSPPLLHCTTSLWCPCLWFCSCSSCLLSFCFCFFLGSVVDSCEFVVVLLFIVWQ